MSDMTTSALNQQYRVAVADIYISCK